MDPFSSQSSHGFEDRIRQMLSGDKPSVRLPPAPNTPQPSPPAGTPVFGHQTRVAMQSGHISAVNSPTQMHHPHLDPNPPAQHQAATNLQFQRHSPMQVPPLGPIRFENPQQHFLPPENGNLPRGQRVDPQHHRIPSIQHSGQFQRHQTHQQNGSHKHQRQQHSLDPENFSRSGVGRGQARPILFDANARPKQPAHMWHDGHQRQAQYLEQAVERHISAIDMSQAERDQKDIFRRSLEDVCHQLCEKNPQLPKVNLECFGSFASGFASAGSDMDLVIVVQNGESSSAVFSLLADDLPRSLEDALLRAGHGARLLSRTRVPIIKICQSPSESFLDKLREERYKWDLLPNEKKYPHLFKNEDNDAEDDLTLHMDQAKPVHEAATSTDDIKNSARTAASSSSAAVKKSPNKPRGVVDAPAQEHETTTETTVFSQDPPKSPQDSQKREQPRTWTRERKAGPLDFPKEGVGIQCDINFFNPLGLHNTQLLRCYSLCDARVRPIVLFVKAWAKLRRVNSSYSGTLSSYGYVLMVLHYLTNIAQPPVLTNLQLPWRPNARCTPQGATKTVVDGWTVDFWRNEDEIQAALHNREMSRNRQSIGSLLAGFFQYYSSMGGGPQFRWTQQVLSLRTPGGILTKDEKGWVKATTEEGDGKKIQHRYLFCIEDPFELAHNVARTVTHNGIVAIRDEFRRAQRILYAIGNGHQPRDGDLLAQLVEAEDLTAATAQLKLGTDITPAETAKRSVEQRPPKQSTSGGIQNSAANTPRKHAQSRQHNKQLDVADQHAFPTLSPVSANKKQANTNKNEGTKKQTNNKKRNGGNARSTTSTQQPVGSSTGEQRNSAEVQGEETANSAVEFLGL